MKYIIFILIFSCSLIARSFTNEYVPGTWIIESLWGHGTVTFAKDKIRKRDGYLTLIFNRNGSVLVKETRNKYYYAVKNNLLYISTTRRHLINALNHGTHYGIDVLYISGQWESCYKVKYKEKHISGFWIKSGYKMCKIKNYPISITTNINDYNF